MQNAAHRHVGALITSRGPGTDTEPNPGVDWCHMPDAWTPVVTPEPIQARLVRVRV